MTNTIHQREIQTFDEISEHDNFGPHAFDADVEFGFDQHAVLFMTEGDLDGYIGYQELGTVIGNRRERFFRTTFTKVPGRLFNAAVLARGYVGDATKHTFETMGTDRATEAGVKHALAQGNYAYMIGTIKNMPNVSREIVYHKVSLLTDEKADPSTNA